MRDKRLYALAMISVTASAFMFAGCAKRVGSIGPELRQAAEGQAEPAQEEAAADEPAVEIAIEVQPEEESQLSDSDFEIYEEIIEELGQYIEEQNFIRFFKAYEEYKEEYNTLSSKLEEQKAAYTEQITSLFDKWIEEADSFAVSGDMENAYKKIDSISEITNMAGHFQELEYYHDILDERMHYYADFYAMTMPVDLMNSHFDMENGCCYKDETDSANPGPYANKVYFIDRYDNVYKKYYDLIVRSDNEYREYPYVIFNADNQYDIFHAGFACHNLMKDYNIFHIEVYGDDTQLYVSDSFTSYNEPMTIDVEITGYKLIKFVAVREDYTIPLGVGRYPSVGLFEAGFLHSETPEFEYYKPQNQE